MPTEYHVEAKLHREAAAAAPVAPALPAAAPPLPPRSRFFANLQAIIDGDEASAVDEGLEFREEPGARRARRGGRREGGSDGRSGRGRAVEFGFNVVFGVHGFGLVGRGP